MEEQTKNILASFILEVIGKPAEHLKEVLKDIIKKVDEEKGVKVTSSKIHEPHPLKDNEQFFTSFADIEIEVEETLNLIKIMFMYMPAHVEIIHPELIALTNNKWSDVLTELTLKLHEYDETARILQNQKAILIKKLQELQPPKKQEKDKEEKKK